ncbi:MAG: hypothetical protein WCB97_11550, partial [Thiobacillus sp.]
VQRRSRCARTCSARPGRQRFGAWPGDVHHLKIDVVLPAFQRQLDFQPLAERADGDVINDRTGRGFGERLD